MSVSYRKLLSTGVFIAFSQAAPAATQPDDFELVTITATRVETKLSDAPATVSVITSEVMERRLVKDIKDLVRFEPGVAVRSLPSRFTAGRNASVSLSMQF
jgi:hemoglobin/transferrin/lactoferrin receptor protein